MNPGSFFQAALLTVLLAGSAVAGDPGGFPSGNAVDLRPSRLQPPVHPPLPGEVDVIRAGMEDRQAQPPLEAYRLFKEQGLPIPL